MFPLAWSAKLETICRLNMSKTTNFDTLSIKTFYMYMYMVGGYSQGVVSFQGPPKCIPVFSMLCRNWLADVGIYNTFSL